MASFKQCDYSSLFSDMFHLLCSDTNEEQLRKVPLQSIMSLQKLQLNVCPDYLLVLLKVKWSFHFIFSYVLYPLYNVIIKEGYEKCLSTINPPTTELQTTHVIASTEAMTLP